jgi:hypothetical protein
VTDDVKFLDDRWAYLPWSPAEAEVLLKGGVQDGQVVVRPDGTVTKFVVSDDEVGLLVDRRTVKPIGQELVKFAQPAPPARRTRTVKRTKVISRDADGLVVETAAWDEEVEV